MPRTPLTFGEMSSGVPAWWTGTCLANCEPAQSSCGWVIGLAAARAGPVAACAGAAAIVPTSARASAATTEAERFKACA